MYEENDSGTGLFIAGLVGVIILIIIGVITFFWSFTAVGTGEVGVVTAWGKVTGRELNEGVSWITPWVDDVTKYDIKTQKEEVSGINAATRDLQDVSGTLVLNYQLERGKVSEIHQRVGENYKDKLITPQLQEIFKAATAKYNAAELITKRAEVKNDVYTQLKAKLAPYGITVQDVAITNFSFSAAFNQAIEGVQIANQKVAQAKQQLEQAKIDAERKIAKAEGDAKSQRLQRQTLSKELLYQQWVEKWDGHLPEYVGGNSTILNLPQK